MAKIKKETVDALSRKPILTTDMSKVKSYQDSLYAYNLDKQFEDVLRNVVKNSSNVNERKNDKLLNNFENKYFNSDIWGKKVVPYFVKDKNGNEIDDLRIDLGNFSLGSRLVNKPVQPYVYGFEKQELNPISPIGLKKTDFESEELSPIELSPIELKNKKVSLKEPEHFLDISNPDGKGTQRIYFDTREELEEYQKENPMLKTGSFSRAKIDPKVLEVLKNKK